MHYINLRKFSVVFSTVFLCFLMSGCFTGIESTKKITLSREDRKNSRLTEEEKFYTGIQGSPLSQWHEGKEFYIADDKAILIFEPHHFPFESGNIHLEGKILKYDGIESRMDPAGNINVTINFTDGSYKFPYNTGKTFDIAMSSQLSSQIPMLIDLQMIEDAKDLLVGKKFWTKTFLWYDSIGERINGRKFVPVTIKDVKPGNMIFPFRLHIEDERGENAWMFMNAGISATDSRAFPILFSLTDIRENYPGISDFNWDKICSGDIAIGMSKEECRLALGNPTTVNSGHDYSQTLDIWNYENGMALWFEDGVLTRFRK